MFAAMGCAFVTNPGTLIVNYSRSGQRSLKMTGNHDRRASDEAMWRPPGEPVAVDAVQVVFDAARAGWQPVSIVAGGWTANFHASALYDPFPDILKWLEAIARGDQGRMSVDLEGSDLELSVFTLSNSTRARIVLAFMSGEMDDIHDVVLDIDVDRRQFVAAFYEALRAYADSDKYVIDEWAALSMRDDLIRKGFLGDPMTQMASCDVGVLNDMLWKLYPSYIVSFPGATTKSEELRRFAEYVKSEEPPEDMVKEPAPKFVVPGEFDAWDAERRQAYINELLNEIVTPYEGRNLRILRSPAIEAFLGVAR
jgi:hypothetical protein